MAFFLAEDYIERAERESCKVGERAGGRGTRALGN